MLNMTIMAKTLLPLPSAIVAWTLSFLLLAYHGVAFAVAENDWRSVIAQGIGERRQGNLNLSIDLLSSARRSADSADARAKAAGELGATFLQARRHEEAEEPLLEAYKLLSGGERARYAMDLGNLAVYRKRIEEARRYYREVSQLTAGDSGVLGYQIGAQLNLARIDEEKDRLARLNALYPKIDSIADIEQRARYHLNLGNQARQLGSQATELAYRNLEQSRTLALKTTDRRLQVESLDALAQLYEDHGRGADALALTQQALDSAKELKRGAAADLLINLEWRQGRLFNAADNVDLALAAYQRAVENIEAVRQDIPIEYEDGRSSFQVTLEPVYLGLAQLLFRRASTLDQDARSAYLYRVRDVVELIKQSEMQDYLGDRCDVEAIHKDNRATVASGVAVLYPIIFSDRTELLLETDAGIEWRSTKVDGNVLRSTAVASSRDLRNGMADFLPQVQNLYQWLIAPFEEIYAERKIHTMIVVPDGALRLVAMSALHDGKRFAIEKFAIATVTGLTMTNSDPAPSQAMSSLVAGMAEPGSVVDKISPAAMAQIQGPVSAVAETSRGLSQTRTTRSPRLRALEARLQGGGDAQTRAAELREGLSLPGVKDEVLALGKILPGVNMLDADFTVRNFQRAAESGDYRIVHIASHGVFSGNADTSYIMAYDNLLTMNDLQSLLKSERFRKNPIELLTLSACETAEGDERSPLGISGAAIKARAKSVLGTLWPVEDNAARTVMEKFYQTLVTTRPSKARALQQAQLDLISTPEFSHPFYWAPFVLIGNWL